VNVWRELLVTTIGVLLGGLGAVALARWQVRHQSASERRRRKDHIASSLEWLRLELGENQELVTELRRVFERGSTPRADLLRWAGSIAGALAFDAQADLIRSGYHRELPADRERSILTTYQTTSALRNMLRQAEPAVDFYVNCCGEEEAARRLVEELRAHTERTVSEIAGTRALLAS
jgi:hypothetical protein